MLSYCLLVVNYESDIIIFFGSDFERVGRAFFESSKHCKHFSITASLLFRDLDQPLNYSAFLYVYELAYSPVWENSFSVLLFQASFRPPSRVASPVEE